MSAYYQRVCEYPGCGKPCSTRASKFCKEHKFGRGSCKPETERKLKRLEAQKRYSEYGGTWKGSPCGKCSNLAMCRIEIARASYWPPCMPASKFYDPKLEREAE